MKSRRKPTTKDLVTVAHPVEYQIIWETPWGDVPGAGLFASIEATNAWAARPIAEHISLSSKYRVMPVQWPRIWRTNPFTGVLAYGPPLSLAVSKIKRHD